MKVRALIAGTSIVTAIAAAVGLLLAGASSIEHSTVDWRYMLRPSRTPSKAVVIVAIDPATGIRLNRQLPPARELQALVVRRLTRAGARVVAYDLALNGVTSADSDQAIVSALRGARNAVVSVTRFDRHGNTDQLAGIASFASTGVRPGDTLRFPQREGTWIKITPAVGRLDSFPIAAASAFEGVRVALPESALIDYRGPPGTVPRLSFIDVLKGQFDPAAVRGKIVVVGDTAPELQDIHEVPVGGKMSGPELQANAMATALAGFPLRTTSAATRAFTAIGLAAALPLLLTGLTLVRSRRSRPPPGPVAILCVGGALTGLWAVASQVAFERGTVVDFVPGVAAALTATALCGAVATVLERRRYEALRQRFADGDPELVEQVLTSPGDGDSFGRLKHIVDGFEIQQALGHGGMGSVYRAIEESLQRPVALKVIKDHYAQDPGYRERFLEEAAKAAAIEHPNVVTVYSVGSAGGTLYMVMRLIDGPDLGTVLATSGSPTLRVTAELLDRIAVALDALSARGVVHCDVKPANILCAGEDREHPYLTDFGIARAAGAPSSSQRRGGTPAYVAPEQIRDDDVTPATDIYALGAVLFQCVTGSVPFPFDDRDDVLFAHATAERPKASERNPALPLALDPLIQRAMAIEPADRFQTAAAFTKAVRDIVRNTPEQPGASSFDRSHRGSGISTEPL